MAASHRNSPSVGKASFTIFKYAVYVLLSVNVALWLREDLAASSAVFKTGMSFGQIIEGYAATIDTLAWVILLLMFELETSVFRKRGVRGSLMWGLHGLRVVCYLFIVYAFYGYLTKLILAYAFLPLSVEDVCLLVSHNYSVVVSLNEYVALTLENCRAFNEGPVYQLGSLSIIADPSGVTLFRNLAWTDVVNSATWILVVIVLEIDVRLQAGRGLSQLAVRLSAASKISLYAILFAAAVYWWVDGEFLDFWDAFLWLVAFVLIELNVFQWQEEGSETIVA